MAEPNVPYEVMNNGTYLTLYYRTIPDLESFDRGAGELSKLADTTHISKLLLIVDPAYDDLPNRIRIEGLNLARGFIKFDKVAIYAGDPKQLDYVVRVTEVLKTMKVIKDPDNFKHFADLEQAKNWIKDA